MNRFHEKWAGMNPAARGIRIVGMVLAGVVGAAVFALVFGWLVMVLWNWLMPAIFHLGLITYWQAFGIVVLGKLIFGGIGGGRLLHRNAGNGLRFRLVNRNRTHAILVDEIRARRVQHR